MYMNKRWEDLNLVGRKVLSWWPGHAFESTAGADLKDTSYVPLLQTNGDGEKETGGENNPFQFAGMIPCQIYRIGERNCALQTICGLAKPWSACLRPVIWLAHFCRAHQVQTLLPSWDGAAGVWFPPWMGEEESCAVFFLEMIAFSLALLYPASLVGTASIFIYHYTVSLGMWGVVWSRYVWIYHS